MSVLFCWGSRFTKAVFCAPLLFCIGLWLSPAKAAGLECPNLGDRGTPALAAEIVALIPKGTSLEQTNRLVSTITLLREHGLSIDSTIDHLVALYCSAVNAQPNLTHQQRLDRVRHFAERARKLVIGQRNVEDVIYDIPLRPGIAEAAAMRAQQSGTTIEKWIAKVVEDAIRHDAPPVAVKEWE